MVVQSFSRPGINEITETGLRVFKTSLAGIRACLFDLELKVKGESRAGVKKEDKLENVLRVYQVNDWFGKQQVLKFLREALKDPDIKLTTPLSWFLEETNG